MKFLKVTCAALLICSIAPAAWASTDAFSSASVDDMGQLHIVMSSGRTINPVKAEKQIGFYDPIISPDKTMIGWKEIQGTGWGKGAETTYTPVLVLYSGNLETGSGAYQMFSAKPTMGIGLWNFRANGNQIAYSSFPILLPPFGSKPPNECVLIDVRENKIVDRWTSVDKVPPPAWADGLSCGTNK